MNVSSDIGLAEDDCIDTYVMTLQYVNVIVCSPLTQTILVCAVMNACLYIFLALGTALLRW